ncbi:hypothetical protein AURDEDRAFT_123294 [Auricularia subglabra TFB-10046 SS5]|nr:hypothetical protein AURDEDRAFT_123294 [Auricularia subglabra TFB-10046 SS5]
MSLPPVSWLVKPRRVGRILGPTIASLIVSGLLFFIAFFLLVAFPGGSAGRNSQVAKFVLWALALLVEIGAYLYAALPPSRGLRRQGSMSERLATLTTVVLGEGLNGMIEPLVSIAKSDVFGATNAIQIMSTGLLILMALILYFSTFDTRAPISTRLQKFIIFVHFPTQLLMLLLEGMKSLLGFLTLSHAIGTLKSIMQDRSIVTLDELRLRLAHVGVDVDDVLRRVAQIAPTPPEAASTRLRVATGIMRVSSSILPVILKQFNLLTDDLKETLDNYTYGTTPSPGPVVEDGIRGLAGEQTGFTLDGILSSIVTEQLNPIGYLAGVAGGFLLCLLLLLFLRGNTHDRYFAWSIVTRLVIGVGIICLNLVKGFTLFSLPVLLAVQYTSFSTLWTIYIHIVGLKRNVQIIHVFMAREVKRSQGTTPPPLPPKYSA